MTTTKLASYVNGDYQVTIFTDGTKEREWDETKPCKPNFPESIDVKITNYCDLNCPYCHEDSTTKGNHGDLDGLLEILKDLPPGIELAIGGGNPLDYPNLKDYLIRLKEMGFIVNLTVNQRHISKFQDMIKDFISSKLIYGLGISLINTNDLELIKSLGSDHIVFHLIAGVNSVDIVPKIAEGYGRVNILVLGYKDFGRGVKRSPGVSKCLKEWYQKVGDLFQIVNISFDNLAIDQLKVKRLISESWWNKLYMGDDFSFSMYIDCIEKTYAPTSRSSDRIPWKLMGLVEYFQKFSKFYL